jgi:hypothetical protein
MPSPLKSPVPITDQFVEMLTRLAEDETCVPLMNQMEVLPLVSRQQAPRCDRRRRSRGLARIDATASSGSGAGVALIENIVTLLDLSSYTS